MVKTPRIIPGIDATLDELSKASIMPIASKEKQEIPRTEPLPKIADFEVASFDNNGEEIAFYLDPETQEIWANSAIISKLFGRDTDTINTHINKIYQDKELDPKATTAKFAVVRFEGGRKVNRSLDYYSLDMILSVGYRVNSKQATEFRKWATGTLKAYLQQGYVINEEFLKKHPEKADKLASEIRAIRNNEKHIYAKVRDCFKISASDYDSNKKEVRNFYALLQDKFHFAITGMQAAKLIMDRADHKEDDMGLQTKKGKNPTLDDATNGKNYLNKDELYRMHLLSEQFLLYAESTALAKRNMTISSLKDYLDKMISMNEYPVFEGYKGRIRDDAEEHARIELELYRKRKALEAQGVEIDWDAFEEGEYDNFLEIED